MKNSNITNFCQISLKGNIHLILKNYQNLKKFYHHLKIYVICPSKELHFFKEALFHKEIEIIDENELLSKDKFTEIFLEYSKNINYSFEFRKRLNWYYQQVLKISFAIDFIKKKKQSIVIWDADTIMIKKIDFFKDNHSIQYGTFNEFHKQYYMTNKNILKSLPKYHLSFLVQFASITPNELSFLEKKLFSDLNYGKETMPLKISEIILSSIFNKHKEYNGSMFSEFELIGQSTCLLKNTKQKPILTLRFGLDGQLNKYQITLIRILNFKHITYEHTHINKKSYGMLNRNQTWFGLVKLIIKNLSRFYLRSLKHNYMYKKCYEKNKV